MNGPRQSTPAWLASLTAVVFAFLYLPIVVLIVYSFNGPGVGGFPPAHFTLRWYRMLGDDSALWIALGDSAIVAVAAVVISLTIGIPAALALSRFRLPGKKIFRRLILLPLILPGIITGISLLMLVVSANLQLSLLTIILGHGTALVSVATTQVYSGITRLDPALEEASLDLGANYWGTLIRVVLPNIKLTLFSAALLIFTLSLDEIAVSFFLVGRENTLPLEIWSRLRRGITPEINAISTLIFLASLCAVLLSQRLTSMRPVSSVELPTAASSLVEP